MLHKTVSHDILHDKVKKSSKLFSNDIVVHRMLSRLFAILFAVAAFCIVSRAHAQFAVNTVVFKDDSARIDGDELNRYFNRARCLCGTDNKFTAEIQLTTEPTNATVDTFEVWAGKPTVCKSTTANNGNGPETSNPDCVQVTPASLRGKLITDITEVNHVIEGIDVKDLMQSDCAVGTANISLYFFTVNNGNYTELTVANNPQYGIDGVRPDAPDVSKVEAPLATDGGISVNTKDITLNTGDTLQLLCVDGSGNGPSSPKSVLFDTPSDICTSTSNSGYDALLSAKNACSDVVQALDGSISAGGLANGKAYDVYLIAVDAAGNPSEPKKLTNAGSVTPIAGQNFWDLYEQAEGKAKGGKGAAPCFVATAAHGDYQHPHVVILRRFRDNFLLSNAIGTRFVDWYYAHSPKYARIIKDSSVLRASVRLVLWPATTTAHMMLWTSHRVAAVTILLLSMMFWFGVLWFGTANIVRLIRYIVRQRILPYLHSASLRSFLCVGLIATGGTMISKIVFEPTLANAASQAMNAREDRLRKGGAFDLDSYYDEYESVQRFAFEIKLAAFQPNVDDEFSGSTKPFENFFQDGKGLMTEIELDYQFLHAIGSLGVGLGLGYFRTSADTCASSEDGLCVDGTRQEGNSSRFSVTPLRALLVYRFDYAFREASIPLVPFIKLGLNYNFWRVKTAAGDVAIGDSKGEGGTAGWQINLGVSMPLDFLEPDSARTLDSDYGVNHTHLFFEWSRSAANGFGAKDRLNVGGNSFTGGLNIEF